MMRLFPAVASTTVILASAASHAEPAPVRTMLAQPTVLATWLADSDPMIAASRFRVEAASSAAAQTLVYPNPQLSAELGGIAIGRGNPDPNTGAIGPTGFSRTTHLSVGVSELFEIGKRGPRQAAARLRTEAATETALGVLGARVGDAIAALGKLAYVAARHEVVATNLEAARKLQALEKTRLDNKDLAASEFARIELDTQQLEIQLARADADVAVALAGCSAALYAPCSTADLDAGALDAAAPVPIGLPAVPTRISERPDHRASRLESSALGQDATLADHRKLPDPTVGLGYSFDNYTYGGNLPQVLALTLSIPLPVFDRGEHDAAAARAAAHAVEAQERASVHEEVSRVEALERQLAILTAALQRLETESLPKSSQIIQQTRRAFDLGQARLPDLLLVERAHRDLLLELLDTRFDLFTIRAQLRQVLGLDDEAARAAGKRKS